MPKKIKRTKPITPVVINRSTKEFRGFTVIAEPEPEIGPDPDNVALSAIWMVPQEDGTIKRNSIPLDAEPIRALPGFDDIVDAIVTASE